MQHGGSQNFKITREQILELYAAGPQAVVELVKRMDGAIESLSTQVQQQQARIEALEQELKKDSHNSGKPPSRDRMDSKQKRRKERSARKKAKRRPGGQEGHAGTTLQMVSDPDEVVLHRVGHCGGCGKSLRGAGVQDYERRQVFELPEIKVSVTEHRAEQKLCECCGKLNGAKFPEAVSQKVQYGSRLRAYGVYIRNYGLLCYQRAAQLFEDLFSVPLSPATLVNMDRICGRRLEGATEQIRQGIIDFAVSGFDETGMSINGKLHWLHTASTEQLTYLAWHPKRGKEAFDAIDILPHFKGRAIHDNWSSYFNYECAHGLCNAHHLRELTFVFDKYHQRWASSMIELLLEIRGAVQRALRRGQRRFSTRTCARHEKRYRALIAAGLRANPPPVGLPGETKPGPRKQSKARNLVLRLKRRSTETLAFMYDFAVPFTNNQAERDLRVSKVQQKISGTFRSTESAISFCRIRSYIATMKKNGIRVIDALQSVVAGTPILPSCLQNG